MSTAALWRAVGEQATAWRATEVVPELASPLPRNAPARRAGLTGALQRVQAGGGSLLANPLRLSSMLPLSMSVTPDANYEDFRARHGPWLRSAARAEGAHRATVAWLRAKMPSYPLLPAPQLVAGTPLTTPEFTYRLVWADDDRRAGLQFIDPVPGLAEVLTADTAHRRAIDQAARDVAAALRGTPEWTRVQTADTALGAEAKDGLAECRRSLRQKLSAASVDAYEPRLALPRAAYREGVLEAGLAHLTGPAREYTEAFTAADAILTMAASDVFAQLVCYDTPTLTVRDLEIDPDPNGARVKFVAADPGVRPEPGMLAWISDPLVPDAVFLQGTNMHWDGLDMTITVSAKVLPESRAAWG